MPKPKKDSHPLTLRMDKPTYDRLTVYCKQSGSNEVFVVNTLARAYASINLYSFILESITKQMAIHHLVDSHKLLIILLC